MRLTSFGPIADADSTFGDLTVLVGPQATGKSILLQLPKLVLDRRAIHAEMHRFGLDWARNIDPFLVATASASPRIRRRFWISFGHAFHQRLIAERVRDPFKGVGSPEPLRHELGGYWSRRITKEHRLVYKVARGRCNARSPKDQLASVGRRPEDTDQQFRPIDLHCALPLPVRLVAVLDGVVEKLDVRMLPPDVGPERINQVRVPRGETQERMHRRGRWIHGLRIAWPATFTRDLRTRQRDAERGMSTRRVGAA